MKNTSIEVYNQYQTYGDINISQTKSLIVSDKNNELTLTCSLQTVHDKLEPIFLIKSPDTTESLPSIIEQHRMEKHIIHDFIQSFPASIKEHQILDKFSPCESISSFPPSIKEQHRQAKNSNHKIMMCQHQLETNIDRMSISGARRRLIFE
jgi:hypothetical protein